MDRMVWSFSCGICILVGLDLILGVSPSPLFNFEFIYALHNKGIFFLDQSIVRYHYDLPSFIWKSA